MNTYYITSAIPFVNARPHVGFALELILADTLARYYRQRGDDVRFLTGSDENSLKNVRAAEQEGLPVAELVTRNAAHFSALREPLALSYDDFIRTSAEARHRLGVDKLWRACRDSGDIYRRAYSGLYCVGCEQFYNESELDNGLCREHQTLPERVEEENYFFRLSRYQDRLLALIESEQLSIEPPSRRNEVLSFIRAGLHDFSISRSHQRARGWGIAVPDDPEQIVYVWFDALGNYINALGYANTDDNTDPHHYQRYWVDGQQKTHVIGKDVLRFHAIYWPALLLSAGVALPERIFAHGFLTINGEKISKSRGNNIDPAALAKRYGDDALRYYLLRRTRADSDSDISTEAVANAYRNDLADQLGNLLQRVIALVKKHHDGVWPAPAEPALLQQQDLALTQCIHALPTEIATAISALRLHAALDAIWALIAASNKYVNDTAPWQLASTDPARLAVVLRCLLDALAQLAVSLTPFLPTAAAAITARLGNGGPQVRSGAALFPKHD